MRRCCPCSQVPGFGSLPRSSLNLILQFEACRQLFNTKSQAVIFSLRATIPFTSQMPNYSLHLISVPQGVSCQGRAVSSFKIGYIRLTAIKFGAGRVMARELDRNNFLFNPSSNSQAQSSQTGALWMYHTTHPRNLARLPDTSENFLRRKLILCLRLWCGIWITNLMFEKEQYSHQWIMFIVYYYKKVLCCISMKKKCWLI